MHRLASLIRSLHFQVRSERYVRAYFSASSSESASNRDIKFTLAERSRYDEILGLIHTGFHRDETMTKALGLFKQDVPRLKSKDDFFSSLMEESCSVMAVDVGRDAVVGAALFHDYRKTYPQKEKYRTEMVHLYPQMRHVYAMMRRLHQGVPESALKRLAGDGGRIASGFICVVARECRGQRILKGMHLEGERIALEKGFSAMICDPTGKYSRRVTEELGYELLTELRYSDYTDETGEKVFGGAIADEHGALTVYGRKL